MSKPHTRFITRLMESPDLLEHSDSIAKELVVWNQKRLIWEPFLEAINKYCDSQKGTKYALQLLAKQSTLEEVVAKSIGLFFNDRVFITVNFVMGADLFREETPTMDLGLKIFFQTQQNQDNIMLIVENTLVIPKKKFWWFQKPNKASWET